MIINTFGNFCYVLTGGIGSGKSTVLSMCKKNGYACLSVDEVCREILDSDESVLCEIVRRWGTCVVMKKDSYQHEIYYDNFKLKDSLFVNNFIANRREISKIVFSDETELIWLENLLHKKIINLLEKKLAKYENSILIVEIPLFFEKEIIGKFFGTTCVVSNFSTRKKRVLERNFTLDQFLFIFGRQKNDIEKMQKSDYVITNNGSLNCLGEQVMLWLKNCITYK